DLTKYIRLLNLVRDIYFFVEQTLPFLLTVPKDGVFDMKLSIFDELELFSKELKRYMSPHA
ncbi:hypothetical protein ACT453_49105, partial [Bacillus sp. D-CC]